MALALVVDNLETVEEPLRGLYKETDGKFRLEVDGVEDTSGLKKALEAERKAAKDAAKAKTELEKKFEGIDPEQARKILARAANDEERQALEKGGVDEVVKIRTERLRAETQRQIEEAKKAAETTGAKLKKYELRVLDDHIRAAASKAGLHPHAVDDALFRGRSLFTLDDDGNAVQIAEHGGVVYGKDGKSPFTPLEWLEGMKEAAPHWFPASGSGGGASGDRGGSGGGKTAKRAAFDAMGSDEKMTFIKAGGKVID